MWRAIGTAVLLAASLSACAQSPQEEAREKLQQRLDAVHEDYLERRAYDPTSTGAEALGQLDPHGDALSASADGDVVTLVETIGVSVTEQRWFHSHEITLGACVRVVVEAGEGGNDRGQVVTLPEACPDGVEVVADNGHQVAELTTDLEARRDGVEEPPPDRPVCYSGGDCSEGGG